MRRLIPSLLGLTLIGCSAPPPGSISIDELLHQRGSRQGTFGPTGKRLFAERLDEGLGVQGQFSYIHYGEIHDPIYLTLEQNGQELPVQAEQIDWYPSHLQASWSCGPLGANERKFITDDDTLVDQLTLSNRSAEPVQCNLQLASGFANRLERWGSSFTTVDLSGVANAHPFPGRDVFTGMGSEPFRAWYEAERPLVQVGAGDVHKSAASGGEVLGPNFGSSTDHFAVLEFASPAIPAAHLYLRVARLGIAAVWNLQLDEKKIGTIHVENTTGWGDADGDFRWIHFGLGELQPGGHTLRLSPQRNHSVAAFDGFYISAEAFTPPVSAAGGVFTADMIEQIAYRPARQTIDGIPFNLIDPDKNDGRGVIVARDVAGDPASAETREIIIPVPGGDANLIHFCGQIAGRLGEIKLDVPIAEYDLQFADGEIERILLTSGDIIKPISAGLNVLTHALPDDRHLLNVIFRSRTGIADAVLAAITLERYPEAGPNYHLLGSDMFYGVRAHAVIASSGFAPLENEPVMVRPIRLGPGESLSVPIALSFAEDIPSAERAAHAWMESPDAFERHAATYQAWFDEQCPRFECDDPYTTRLYWYRWFLARHCLSRAATGNLSNPCFFEGMHGRGISSLNAGSSSQIISEVRWLRDPEYAYGQVRNHARTAEQVNHYFQSARVDWTGRPDGNWIGKAAWETFWVHPDLEWLREVIPNVAGDVLGVLYEFDRDQDLLPASSRMQSAEIQNQSADDADGRGLESMTLRSSVSSVDNNRPRRREPADTRLERPDLSAFVYGNAAAVAEIYKILGYEQEARNFTSIAGQIRDACLSKQWDDHGRFVYTIGEDDDQKVAAREITGFYPFMTRLMPNESRYAAALQHLPDPAEFWTAFPPATISKESPGYSPSPQQQPSRGRWPGRFVWNGANHPSATSMALNVLAAAVQDYRQTFIKPEHFWHALQRYTHMQFESNDLARPMVRECYDSQTGAAAGAPDHFDSDYCDLVIRYVVGLQPANTRKLTLRPIPGPLQRFSLRHVRYRGHDLDIVYNRAGGLGGRGSGLTVWVDGRWAGHRNSLGELTVELPEVAAAPAPPASPWSDAGGEKQVQ